MNLQRVKESQGSRMGLALALMSKVYSSLTLLNMPVRLIFINGTSIIMLDVRLVARFYAILIRSGGIVEILYNFFDM